jgi:hypothetical protein
MPFNHVQGGLHALGFFNGDDAFFADLVHGFGNDVADGFVIVGGNGAHLSDFALILGGFAHLVKFFDGDFNGFVDAAFDGHGVVAGGNQFLAFFIDGSARTVAVVVPSPAMSLVLLATSLTIWAPMFSNLSSSSISLATVTPSLVTVGSPRICR